MTLGYEPSTVMRSPAWVPISAAYLIVKLDTATSDEPEAFRPLTDGDGRSSGLDFIGEFAELTLGLQITTGSDGQLPDSSPSLTQQLRTGLLPVVPFVDGLSAGSGSDARTSVWPEVLRT
jgi:hypothetical protein